MRVGNALIIERESACFFSKFEAIKEKINFNTYLSRKISFFSRSMDTDIYLIFQGSKVVDFFLIVFSIFEIIKSFAG